MSYSIVVGVHSDVSSPSVLGCPPGPAKYDIIIIVNNILFYLALL